MADDEYPTAELAEAERTEAAIAAVLAGVQAPPDVPTASVVDVLARAYRVEVPHRLLRPAPVRRRAPLALRVASALLGVAFLVHGVPSVVDPGWVSRFAGLAPSPHAFREGGLAFIAVAGLLLAAVFRPRLLGAAALSGSGLAVAVAINGAGEIGSVLHAEGGRLHLAELVLGLALAALWLRYRTALRDE